MTTAATIVRCLAVAVALPFGGAAAQTGTGAATGAGKEAGTGTITGPLSYPSDYIPKRMEVCAEPAGGGAAVCSARQIKLKGKAAGLGFSLTVPAGRYQVYARILPGSEESASYPPDYRAYYSDFVVCGSNAACPYHTPVVVEVAAGKTTANISPSDWYAN